MGMQGIDAAEKVLGVQRRCRTADTPILGAAGYDEASFTASGGWEDHLAERYGTESRFVSQIMADDPAMREPIVAGQPYLAAEVVYAARHEMAHTVDDVLARRTRLRLFARDASDGAARRVAGLMAPELGWTPQQVDHQVAAYHEAIQTERQLLTTNTEAQA
ncbi:glycerol-3-phosphate dehydrogenase C-terminal domain-containing protein [Propionibacterium freudenreichii]